MSEVLNIVKSPEQTYQQKVLSLARSAENSIDVLDISPGIQKLRDEKIICDLYEGNAPYRPRYILPDYDMFMEKGCHFLKLEPPNNVWEATNNLLIFYKHVPSITSFPVYLGNIDELLEPFINKVSEEEAYSAIKLFLNHIDRTLTDSFCHANIGPEETLAGQLILRAERELQNSVPNLTMKCSNSTTDKFILDGIKTAVEAAKPSFANDKIFRSEFGDNYAIASCYNGLHIGGGSHTLVRLNLARLCGKSSSLDQFLENVLPETVDLQVEYIKERIKFLVEDVKFFETSFLVEEGFISLDRFTAMFGIVGLAECVNHFVDSSKQENRFGHSQAADEIGLKIIDRIKSVVEKSEVKYCKATNNRVVLHAQVGISDDYGVTPGCRVPIGDEPELYKQMLTEAKFHPYFPSGIGNIYPFEPTVKRNPKAILDVLKGAFKIGMRYFSVYSSDSDIVRISGYLVKRSEIEKLNSGSQVLKDTVELGRNAVDSLKIFERKVRK